MRRPARSTTSPFRARRGASVIALLATLAFAGPEDAQGVSTPAIDPTTVRTPDLDPTDQIPEGTGVPGGDDVTLLFAPVPFKNSQLGWGLLLLGGAIHRFDPDTTYKPSIGGVGGFYTENESWGVMAVEVARFARDTWRVRGLVSHAEINYDFFGIGEDAGTAGQAVGMNQVLDFAAVLGLRRVTGSLYAGASFLWLRTTATPTTELPPDLPPIENDLTRATLVAPGLQAELDTRDDDYWPRRGSLATAKGWFFSNGLGSSRSFQRYSLGWTWHQRLGSDRYVLAANLNSQAVTGDAPFYALPSVGAGLGGLRGYTQGRYRDDVAITVQAEGRYHSEGRFGATAFGGFAQVAPTFGDLGDALVLPAGGIGVRWQLTRRYPMHMRFDYAWGRDGGLFYFSIGEAF